MEKTEFAVGETIQFGLKKLKVTETPYELKCLRCVFTHECYWDRMKKLVGECDADRRSDGRNIVFEEVEE